MHVCMYVFTCGGCVHVCLHMEGACACVYVCVYMWRMYVHVCMCVFMCGGCARVCAHAVLYGASLWGWRSWLSRVCGPGARPRDGRQQVLTSRLLESVATARLTQLSARCLSPAWDRNRLSALPLGDSVGSCAQDWGIVRHTSTSTRGSKRLPDAWLPGGKWGHATPRAHAWPACCAALSPGAAWGPLSETRYGDGDRIHGGSVLAALCMAPFSLPHSPEGKLHRCHILELGTESPRR